MVIKMWALVSNKIVMEITRENPYGKFHPSMMWVECGDDIKAGWLHNDGVFSETQPYQPTVAEQIAVLEASITPRNLRGAFTGDQFAIDKIQAVEDEIAALR